MLLLASYGVASAPPPLPPNAGEQWVSLEVPAVAPGASGSLGISLTNPLSASVSSVSFTMQFYRWAVAGGSNGTIGAGDAWAPQLSLGGQSPAQQVVWSGTSLTPGASVNVPVTVDVPSTAPAGSYFLRDALNFTESSGVHYTMLSRGYFSASLWQRATLAANGTPILNLTLLNVSGIVPETTLTVGSSSSNDWIWVFLGASLGLAAIGGYLWVRSKRGPRSSSGAKPSVLRK